METKTNTNPKQKLNALRKALMAMLKPTYFQNIPVREIAALVAANGFNDTELDGIYTGRDGRATAGIGDGLSLTITWHKMEVSGRFEIIGYIS